MASLQDIRRRIKSVKSTQQITKAMKMVAAARLRRAQEAAVSNQPYAEKSLLHSQKRMNCFCRAWANEI